MTLLCLRPKLVTSIKSLIHFMWDWYFPWSFETLTSHLLNQFYNSSSWIKEINSLTWIGLKTFLMSLGMDVSSIHSCIKKDQRIKLSTEVRIKDLRWSIEVWNRGKYEPWIILLLSKNIGFLIFRRGFDNFCPLSDNVHPKILALRQTCSFGWLPL